MHFGIYLTLLLPFICASFQGDEGLVERYKLEIEELNTLIQNLESRLESTENENVEYAGRLMSAEKIIERLTGDHALRRRDYTEAQIAFYVKLDGSLHGLTPHQTVIFDVIVTNTSALYDTATGEFTAPINGMYVFSWTANVNHREAQSTELVVDGQVKAAGFADTAGKGDGDYGSASQTVVLQVDKGNKVLIRTGTEGKGSLHGADYSTFSGFLLFPMN